jgi:transcriptional regulator with XRE-family HTH domain
MLTPEQSRAARGLVGWTQERLAQEARVGLSTVRDFESRRRSPIENNLRAVQRALEAAGVEFTNGNQPGVRMKSSSK